MVEIKSVEKHSIAEKAGVRAGDMLIAVNGNAITDVLDYRFYIAEEKLTLSLCRAGEHIDVKLKKPQYDDLGLEFETYLMDEKQSCRNKCVFCFIDQNPKGMRKDIYFKDDDSRLSFFFGNYITLTNLSDADIDRIIKMHISPVNVSVHTTNPELRVKMMKNKHAGECLRYLDTLAAADITINGQVVLCKGLNDGKELEKTLRDLSALYPSVGSVAVVPSGLTKHREGLYPLEPFDAADAKNVIALIDRIRAENREKYGEPLVQASDEWYLTAGLPLPDEDYYDDYPQLDNGVGSITSMKNEIEEELAYLAEDGVTVDQARTVSVVTGVAAYAFIKASCEAICKAFPQVHIQVYRVINHFFGESITVAGLLTGKDMREQLTGKELGETLYIPAVTLKSGEAVFLDDMTVDELSAALNVPIVPSGNDGGEFVRTLLGLDGGCLSI